ncbi:hypothetical protein R50912_27015 [Paenibacillus sp. FSL R5-0912]|nr:hypothetical protein R50912_27015 [Paenibacillus sp. FSL R5-0912]
MCTGHCPGRLIIPPGDATLLARLLEQLLDNEELRVRTGFQAREWAQRSRSLDVMAAGTLNVYRKAISMRESVQSPAVRSILGAEPAAGPVPGAFHPADVLNAMYPGIPLAASMRARLPHDYSIPDPLTVLTDPK